MEQQKTEKKRSHPVRRMLLLILLLCAAAFLMYSRLRAMEEAEQLQPPPLNERTDDIPVTSVEPAAAPSDIPEEVMEIPPEEAVTEEEEIAAEVPEETGSPLPVLHDDQDRELSFYQKLDQGCGVNILIMGDLSATGEGASEVGESADGRDHRWFIQLSDYLRERYLNGQTPYISSLAAGDASIMQDVLLLKDSSDETDYDLILFSYGLNEKEKDAMAFEALILTLHEKYPNASFITTLEPCLHRITAPMLTMRDISRDYDVPVINLFGRFYDDSASQEEYVSFFEARETFPGDKGQDAWFELLKNEIDENVKASTGKLSGVKPLDAKALQFAEMKYLPVENPAVRRLDDTSYEINAKVNGLAYMVHTDNLGNADVKAVADDILYAFRKPNGILLGSDEYLSLIFAEFVSKNLFTITFSNKEYADGLRGFYLYCPD